jgi:hypothetical protein
MQTLQKGTLAHGGIHHVNQSSRNSLKLVDFFLLVLLVLVQQLDLMHIGH